MGRKTKIINYSNPISIGATCINKDWFGMEMCQVWDIVEEQLFFAKHAFELNIYQFVLMSNHFHLMASAPKGNLSQAMGFFLSQTGTRITRCAGRINHTWSSRFFRCEIDSIHYYYCAYKYFYRNPVEAGISRHVEDYPWSSLYGLLGGRHMLVPLEEDTTLFDNIDSTLAWLNTSPSPQNREVVRKALRKRKFKLPMINKVPHPLNSELY